MKYEFIYRVRIRKPNGRTTLIPPRMTKEEAAEFAERMNKENNVYHYEVVRKEH